MKLVLYFGLFSLLIGSAYGASRLIYGKGVADTELAYEQRLNRIRENAASEAVRDYKASQVVAGKQIDKEIQIVTEIREVEREVEVIVDRIVEVKPDCAVMPELGSVFSRQAAAANGAAIHLADDTG